MAPSLVHLPNGQTLTVTPVFGGFSFKSNELSRHNSAFPAGWTVILHSEDDDDDSNAPKGRISRKNSATEIPTADRKHGHIHRYQMPTLRNDHIFISSISQPSSSDFKPPSSPTRQIAMMLWATLWWYFHQPAPDPTITTEASKNTAPEGRPKGEWRININREGVFKGRNLLPKLERMGLIASEDSCVGSDPNDRSREGWTNMFVSRRSFWQLDARLYLFTLSPVTNSPYPASSPYPSRPGSPTRLTDGTGTNSPRNEPIEGAMPATAWMNSSSGHHFQSGSHLPTYYPPPPPQYIMTDEVRHPIRPKPPRQGETFYTRYIPSVNQYLSFRVASLSRKAPTHHGPVSTIGTIPGFRNPRASISDSILPTILSLNLGLSDVELLHKWMNELHISHFWGVSGDQCVQEEFLRRALESRHSFPAIGCWDGTPFGYFEIYWVKEDNLGRYMGGHVGDFDRGFHCLAGEEEFKEPNRVRVWLSALVHSCLLADLRTNAVLCEPRVDDERLKQYCIEAGFYKEREIAFPHKQANFLKFKREAFEAPAL